ncbi:pupal cuticle protein Edg-84A-like [Onthophagus taurus]|uniref:pupal cuticle protein Edg-84A-like n=1 Tax=Onthophagus taurus TaxID=166361 RepID=UPI000C20678C|nr:pupal cuticle protein Edg-84A-like [Onthophagus taurus]
MCSKIMKSTILLLCIISITSSFPAKQPTDDSVSYHRFNGPVSGDIKEVILPDPTVHNPNRLAKDFVAKPDYQYSYGVRDPVTGNAQEHQENRDGDAVHGQYTVLQADGTMRIVRYTADDAQGFVAEVEYIKPDGTRHKEKV